MHKVNNYKGSIYMVCDYMDHDLTGLMERRNYKFTLPQVPKRAEEFISPYGSCQRLMQVQCSKLQYWAVLCMQVILSPAAAADQVLHEAAAHGAGLLPQEQCECSCNASTWCCY